MVIGYVLIGALAGLFASVAALLLGASPWLAFGLYPLVGSSAALFLAVARMIVASLTAHDKAPTDMASRRPQGSSLLDESAPDQLAPAAEPSMRILAVDDDPFILELLPMISAKVGFSEVALAASGDEALRLLQNAETAFDCLLLDISMPGMDGIELCRRIRRMPRYRQTPIVMLTAMRDMQNMGDAYRAGATDYATKPFDIEELGTRLRMAQKTIRAQRETGQIMQAGARYHHRHPIPDRTIELAEGRALRGMDGLVDHAALSSYLTQLPRKDVAEVRVFAVSIDGVQAVHSRSSPEQFAALIEDLAAAAIGCFGADQTVMAYTKDATLLVATNLVSPLPAISIESDIAGRLKCDLSEDGSGEGEVISVSVGGPVRPESKKADRARTATDRAITLAQTRELLKQGRQIAGLFKG